MISGQVVVCSGSGCHQKAYSGNDATPHLDFLKWPRKGALPSIYTLGHICILKSLQSFCHVVTTVWHLSIMDSFWILLLRHLYADEDTKWPWSCLFGKLKSQFIFGRWRLRKLFPDLEANSRRFSKGEILSPSNFQTASGSTLTAKWDNFSDFQTHWIWFFFIVYCKHFYVFLDIMDNMLFIKLKWRLDLDQ